ncbi:MAG: TetR/AcrR family transcriptional regulator [Thermoleophilia bacterium]
MPRPRTDTTARRAALVSAATAVFADRGVANTAVSDIVRAAGVAQGTFYLYFDSKDDIIVAAVERVVEGMVDALEAIVTATGGTAVERFLGFRDALAGFESNPAAVEMAEILHRPENRALHDRLTEHLVPRLLPLVESIVEQGIAEGVFDVADPHAASWFVLGGLQSAELSGTSAEELPAALTALTDLALRALGYSVSPSDTE